VNEEARRSASAPIARVHLFAVDVDALKRIVHYIEYFSSGGGVTPDPGGESLLDASGAR